MSTGDYSEIIGPGHLRRNGHVKSKWVHGCYMAAVQWVHGSSKANQLPEITNLWSDSAINCSVNGFMALQKPKSYGFEQLVAVTCPLRAVEMVSGPWRCDEQLLSHLFALGSSCLGECQCRCGASFLLFFRVGWIASGRCPHRSAGQGSLAM